MRRAPNLYDALTSAAATSPVEANAPSPTSPPASLAAVATTGHDVFLSYARQDQTQAYEIAKALQTEGVSVWWDTNIVPGQRFDKTIEAALAAARSVVVLWSQVSVASDWVRNEATVGMDRRILIPVLLGIDPKETP